MDWTEIDGWCDFAALYFEQVKRARPGARFVEVGCWKGKSTAYMAQKIKESGKDIEFHAVDHFLGGSDLRVNGKTVFIPEDLHKQFEYNMTACGVRDLICLHHRPSLEAVNTFPDESLDFVFIDGDHHTEAVLADLRAWYPKVKPGGLIAGHDFEQIEPRAAVLQFQREIGHGIFGDGAASQNGYHCFGIPKPIKEERRIFLAIPNYDGNARVKTVKLATSSAYSGVGGVYLPDEGMGSLLAANFNQLWCMALNDVNFTHFAMLHADIVPARWWLDVLMHELEATNSQLISAIVPIKDDCGVTSTGIANPDLIWSPLRRFTMKEVMVMPATFNADQAGYPGKNLVLNTGCWLADIRDDRWRDEDEYGELKCYFTIKDRITRLPGSGKYLPWCQPEDFFFSNRAQELGISALATRKVQLEHMGFGSYPNYKPWGIWDVDEATRPSWEDGRFTQKESVTGVS